MTNTSANTSAPAPRARTGRFQGLANQIIRGLLATPGISAGIGARLVTIYAVGRKSGRVYTVPVAYTKHEGKLLIGTPFGWAKNLRTGEPVTIRLKGRKVQAGVEAFTGEDDVTRLYAVMCRDNKTFANFNQVRLGADGEPDAGDLRAAWDGGARAFLLSPR
ncbi:MAG TPA: nitroreductase/quinone reductase family protein [Trebonia sp.]|jgi:deazaflavin-dependent oxidoreductase (nitroreductase family)